MEMENLGDGETGRLSDGVISGDEKSTLDNLVSFMIDRLKVYLRDQGVRHDLIDAVFALGQDDLVAIVERVEALQSFLSTDDGGNLLAGYKRAANILKAESKKGALPDGEPHKGDSLTFVFEESRGPFHERLTLCHIWFPRIAHVNGQLQGMGQPVAIFSSTKARSSTVKERRSHR